MERLHLAIIMDGNGRWAERRGHPRTAGHRRGADAARSVIEAAPGLGVTRLTLFAFSSDNWQRPAAEVGALMELLRGRLRIEGERCRRNGVRLRFVGRRDRLDPGLRATMIAVEEATREGRNLDLRVALDYSARESIVRAARRAVADAGALTAASLERWLGPDDPLAGQPAVDLLIRTGGEQRLSDFLLWECAYAELHFTDTLWPDFDASELRSVVNEFHRRDRRFGRVPVAAGRRPGVRPAAPGALAPSPAGGG